MDNSFMDSVIYIDMATERRSIKKSAYYQYDKGLKVRLINVPDCSDYSLQIEMCNAGDSVIKYCFPYSGNDTEIPKELLLNGRNIQIYIFAKGSDWGKTILDIALSIIRRPSR